MPTGGTGGSQAAEDFNHDIYIPLEHQPRPLRRDDLHPLGRVAQRREGRSISQVTLTVTPRSTRSGGRVKATGDRQAILEQEHDYKKDWAVTVPLDRLEEAERAQDRFTQPAGADRVDLAVRRRHRHHEHHAGDGDRADAGDRHPPGARGEAEGHHTAVPGRGRGADDDRRAVRAW